ncbi:MAG: toprim domain-containing protein [Rhodoferax sp.]|nr:toprim domain-containing protein [Rhodoferax sp.]
MLEAAVFMLVVELLQQLMVFKPGFGHLVGGTFEQIITRHPQHIGQTLERIARRPLGPALIAPDMRVMQTRQLAQLGLRQTFCPAQLTQRLRPGTPLHMYLPAHDARGRGVFNLAALQASKEIILCEAIIDALTFWCAGYRNVTTAYGVEGFTDEMLAAFKANGVERVLIAYDRDEAGERAAQKLAPQLQAAGMEVWRIEFPFGLDANEYALKVTPAAKSLGILIRKAAWMGKGEAPPAARPDKGSEPPALQAKAPEPPPTPTEPGFQVKQAASPREMCGCNY